MCKNPLEVEGVAIERSQGIRAYLEVLLLNHIRVVHLGDVVSSFAAREGLESG